MLTPMEKHRHAHTGGIDVPHPDFDGNVLDPEQAAQIEQEVASLTKERSALFHGATTAYIAVVGGADPRAKLRKFRGMGPTPSASARVAKFVAERGGEPEISIADLICTAWDKTFPAERSVSANR